MARLSARKLERFRCQFVRGIFVPLEVDLLKTSLYCRRPPDGLGFGAGAGKGRGRGSTYRVYRKRYVSASRERFTIIMISLRMDGRAGRPCCCDCGGERICK